MSLRTTIDRPNTTQLKTLDRMFMELSPHMTELEIDQVIEFMHTISNSKWDINPSVTESATQIKLILGSERYQQVKALWSIKNKHLITDGKTKYLRKTDQQLFDGLDESDNVDDYIKLEM